MIETNNRFFARLPRNVIALGLVSLFNDASSELIYPLLPMYLTGALGVSAQFVGLMEGIAESASSLLKFPAGWLSDRVGKRKGLIIAGYATATAVRPLLAIATAAWQVLGLRFTDRLGKGIRSAPRDALLADSANAGRRGQAFGFHRAMDHTGAIAGSLLSAWLFSLFAGDYHSVFLAAAIPGFIGLLILIFAVREAGRGDAATRRHGDIQSDSQRLPVAQSPRLSLTLFDNNFKRYLAVLLLFTLGNSSDAFLLLRARQNGVAVVLIPILWAVLHISKTVSSLVGGGLSDRFGRKRLIVSGWLVYAAIYFGFAFSTTRFQTWLLFILYGVYFGLTEGVEKALVTDLVKPALRGTAFGLYNLVIGIGALPASLVTGWMWDRFGAALALAVGAGLSLLASLFLILTIHEHKNLNE